MMTNLQIRKKFVLLGNQIVRKYFRIKVSFYVLFLSAVLLLIAFAHIPYVKSDVKGILGFKWMMSFLFALALPLTQISSGLLIKFLSSIVQEDFKTYFNRLSNLVIALGFFFLLWTLSPGVLKGEILDFPYYNLIYYSTMILLSISLCFIAHHLHEAVIKLERKLKSTTEKAFRKIIKRLLSLLITDIYDIVKDDKKDVCESIYLKEIEVISERI